MDAEIESLRADLDEVDASLLRLLRLRVKFALRVAARKRELGIAVHDPRREQEIVGRVEEGPVRDAYRAIVERCRREGQRRHER